MEPDTNPQSADADPAQAADPCDEQTAAVDHAAVEAILFATDNPLSAAKIAEVACLPGGRREARRAVEILNERYEQMGCAFRVESLAGGYQMLTLPEYNDVLARLLKVRSEGRLTQAGMETLAIVAYKQPVLRADVEAIRGVSVGEVMRNLMAKGLVRIVGRADEIGRPMLYGTTRKFLEVFGLANLKDLPQVAELASGAAAERPTDKPAEKAVDEAADERGERPVDQAVETDEAADEPDQQAQSQPPTEA